MRSTRTTGFGATSWYERVLTFEGIDIPMRRGRNTLYIDYRSKGAASEYDDEQPGMAHYTIQSAIAAVLVTGTIVLSQYVTSVLALAALASTAFVVFARPKSIEATPRNVLGGHVLSIGSAAVICLIARHLPLSETMTVIAFGGPAVAVSMFLMAVTDTEHAPAAGAALAMVAHVSEFVSIGGVMLAGGVVISVAGVVSKRWLRDLT